MYYLPRKTAIARDEHKAKPINQNYFAQTKNAEDFLIALGKLENIVAETLCFLSMFPCVPTSGNIVPETKFASHEEKNASQQIQKHFCCGNNVS